MPRHMFDTPQRPFCYHGEDMYRGKLPEFGLQRADRAFYNVEPLTLKRLFENTHEIIMAIDFELSAALDWQYRQLMVRAAYKLRNLEELLQKDQAGVL